MKNKKFIITIDTEGDNQWNSAHLASTENAKFIPRFQTLCNKYDFYPTWLVDYEMAEDDFLVSYLKEKLEQKKCEVGMHLHAWSTPPAYQLEQKTDARSYLIEYPKEIMQAKIAVLKKLLEDRFETTITSHRSGRWSINQGYFDLLEECGIIADCSVTPHKSWATSLGTTGMPGSDFSASPEKPHKVTEHVLEVPMTIRNLHHFEIDGKPTIKNYLRGCKHLVLGKPFWLRPNRYFQVKTLRALVKHQYQSDEEEYCMFMIHSSELMPGDSPSFPTKEAIEHLYLCIEQVFSYAQSLGYEGITLTDYAQSCTM